MTTTSPSPVVVERTFDAPASKIWAALTEPDQMKNWYFDLPGFKAEPGYEFQFSGGPAPERQYLHLCKIAEVVPLKKLAYSWRFDGYPGDSLVTFELFPEGEKTRLKLTHSGLETFAHLNPDFAVSNFVQGWTEILGSALADFLAAGE